MLPSPFQTAKNLSHSKLDHATRLSKWSTLDSPRFIKQNEGKGRNVIRGFFFFLKKSTIYFPRTLIKNSLEKVRMLKGRAKIRIELSCYQTSFALGCERVPHRKEIRGGYFNFNKAIFKMIKTFTCISPIFFLLANLSGFGSVEDYWQQQKQ